MGKTLVGCTGLLGMIAGTAAGGYAGFQIADSLTHNGWVDVGAALVSGYLGFRAGPYVGLVAGSVISIPLDLCSSLLGLTEEAIQQRHRRRLEAKGQAYWQIAEDFRQVDGRVRQVLSEKDYRGLLAAKQNIQKPTYTLETALGAVNLYRDPDYEMGVESVRDFEDETFLTRGQRSVGDKIAGQLGINLTDRAYGRVVFQTQLTVGNEQELVQVTSKILAAESTLTRHLAGEKYQRMRPEELAKIVDVQSRLYAK